LITVPYTTQQKLILAEVLQQATRPLTPSEICSEAKKSISALGIATVYRALKQFVDEGSVRIVEVPGTSPHYESSARHHHHFFLCGTCNRLFNLVGCLRGVNALAPSGFQVEKHEIVLYGACSECQKAA